MTDEAIEAFPEPDPELAALISCIAPMQFVRWAREETNKKRIELREAPISPTDMEDSSLMWIHITGMLGMTAVGFGRGAHQYLILKIDNERARLYDPMRGKRQVAASEVSYDSVRFSKNIFSRANKARGAGAVLKDFLSAEEYELDVSLGRIQEDRYNCCPLALYAALLANAKSPRYARELNVEEIKRIA
ncbi:MAG TPA: hypothetical protein VI933_03025 [archaeon]|nr:hypothetical protein [archaeon]